MEGRSRADIEETVLSQAQIIVDELGLHNEVELIGARVYGSRSREGLYRPDSDVDVALSYQGPISEDSFFNYLKEDMLYVKEIPIDINPISKTKSGTLPEYLERAEYYLDEKEYVVRTVMKINTEMPGAYVFSSGKNMGTFKAVGYPEDIGIFYKLDEYEGYSWTAHGRYPTNTPGWWGGAHPFALLDSSVVHNGEISSYDANRRFMEMFGYKCTLQTDTEVITYILDYLLRRQNLTLGEAASVIAAPFWSTIAAKTDLADQKKHTYLRTLFPSLLITGPFSIVFGFNGGLMALNDRLKLRSMVVGEKKDMVYIASEETAIRAMEPDAENIWAPAGGEPVIVTVKEGVLL